MFESFLITLRETLEAALIVGIVLAFLKKNGKEKYYPLILTSIGAALVVSLLGAYLFSVIAGGFEGRAEEIFEGITMLVAAGLLSYMILWLYLQKNVRHQLEQKLLVHAEEIKKAGLFFLVFFAVLREGVETVIFLNALAFQSGGVALSGGFAGVFAAIVIGYALFVLEVKLPLKYFFKFSGILLILFAAGLLAHGVHELEEAGLVPIIVEHLYDINAVLPESGTLGEFMKGLFGYNANPSLTEFLSYIIYVITAFCLFFRPFRPAPQSTR